MDPDERRQRILADVEEEGEDLIPRLGEKYGVSEMTIRRDLKALEEEGLIVRTYGGAMIAPQFRDAVEISSWERRRQRANVQKEAIARHAAGLVEEGDILILEGGTTAAALVPFLAGKRHLKIVTNGLPIITALAERLGSEATLICTGGMFHPETRTFIGPVTNRFFSEFHAHRLFLSATGFTLETGATDPEMLGTETKHRMVEAAKEVILLLDSSKFGVTSLMNVLALEQIALLITDDGAPKEMIDGLRARGVAVTLVSAEEPPAG